MYSVEHASSMDPTVMEEGGGVTGSGPDSAPPPPPPPPHMHTHPTAQQNVDIFGFHSGGLSLEDQSGNSFSGEGGCQRKLKPWGNFEAPPPLNDRLPRTNDYAVFLFRDPFPRVSGPPLTGFLFSS